MGTVRLLENANAPLRKTEQARKLRKDLKKLSDESKQSALGSTFHLAQVFVGKLGDLPPPWRAHNKALLYQKWFVHLFQGLGTFGYCCGQCGDAYGAAFEFINDGGKYLVVHFIQTMGIHIERFETKLRYFQVNIAVPFNLCKVAHPSQKGVTYSGGSAATACNFNGRIGGDGHF